MSCILCVCVFVCFVVGFVLSVVLFVQVFAVSITAHRTGYQLELVIV